MSQTYREATWDETSFALFYQAHASPLLDYLHVLARTLEDAEDILVEVFMAARQNQQIARENSRGQLAWLRQVARNKMVDYYRRQGQTRLLPLEQAESLAVVANTLNPELALLQAESLAQLQTALQRLPAQQQELSRLRFAEDLRCPQIATRMGKRAGAIRTMLLRTLRTLRGMYPGGTAMKEPFAHLELKTIDEQIEDILHTSSDQPNTDAQCLQDLHHLYHKDQILARARERLSIHDPAAPIGPTK